MANATAREIKGISSTTSHEVMDQKTTVGFMSMAQTSVVSRDIRKINRVKKKELFSSTVHPKAKPIRFNTYDPGSVPGAVKLCSCIALQDTMMRQDVTTRTIFYKKYR